MSGEGDKPTCFIAMPITTRTEDVERYMDEDHWAHVMESLFVRAIEAAGFEAIRPAAQGAHLIHGLIIKHLSTADLFLVDLSSHNPNVFFELGVRTSLNRPIALVRDEHTHLPFDTSGINTYQYDSNLRGWEIENQQSNLGAHIRESHRSCDGQNPLWRQFGLTITASQPQESESPFEAKVDILSARVADIQQQLKHDRNDRLHELDAVRMIAETEALRWAEHQASDPSRAAPSELLEAAIERFVRGRFHYSFHASSPTAAHIHISDAVPRDHLARIAALAERYEVHLEMFPSETDGPGSGPATRATRSSTQRMAEQAVREGRTNKIPRKRADG